MRNPPATQCPRIQAQPHAFWLWQCSNHDGSIGVWSVGLAKAASQVTRVRNSVHLVESVSRRIATQTRCDGTPQTDCHLLLVHRGSFPTHGTTCATESLWAFRGPSCASLFFPESSMACKGTFLVSSCCSTSISPSRTLGHPTAQPIFEFRSLQFEL
jgi:hypothetical protein